ncbi:MAG: YlbF family regulator [Actinomycetota bacterium]
MDRQMTQIAPALMEAADVLGASLASSPPFVAYRLAQARLEDDEHARTLLDHLAEVERDVRKRQADGGLTRDDIDRVRAAQNETWSDPVVMELATAQRGAAAYVPQINKLITELLGVDVAALAGAGGC